MKPIEFTCEVMSDLRPNTIAEQILDITRWSEFAGYGLLPGIKSAEFEVRTTSVVGSRIRVTNTDGSTHLEEIVEWEPNQKLVMHMSEFSAPLSFLATGFDEVWEFARASNSTTIVRSFKMHARSTLAKPLLWLISILLKRAIDRQLRQLTAGELIKKSDIDTR